MLLYWSIKSNFQNVDETKKCCAEAFAGSLKHSVKIHINQMLINRESADCGDKPVISISCIRMIV